MIPFEPGRLFEEKLGSICLSLIHNSYYYLKYNTYIKFTHRVPLQSCQRKPYIVEYLFYDGRY